jgi:hypothetical protein
MDARQQAPLAPLNLCTGNPRCEPPAHGGAFPFEGHQCRLDGGDIQSQIGADLGSRRGTGALQAAAENRDARVSGLPLAH